jgi:hypothetical protein
MLASTLPSPWFRTRPALTLAVAGVLYAGVLLVRLLEGDATDAYSMFYVFPVALVATSFGARAGIAAGAVAVALVVTWVVAQDVSLTPAGWVSRAVPLLALGALLGSASDRLREAETERRALEATALLHRQAIEINDSLVQGMVAAKWALEAGQADAGLTRLGETITRGQQLVSTLIREADMSGRTEKLHEQPGPAEH